MPDLMKLLLRLRAELIQAAWLGWLVPGGLFVFGTCAHHIAYHITIQKEFYIIILLYTIISIYRDIIIGHILMVSCSKYILKPWRPF